MSAWIWEMLILVTALSVDTFAAGFVYGVSGVKVPGVSVWILTGVSGLLFVAALFVGGAAGRLLPEHLARVGGCLFLTVLGLWKLAAPFGRREAERADRNQDRRVSPMEAAVLGAMLSADGLAAGVGSGFLSGKISFLRVGAFGLGSSVAAGMGAFLLGKWCGRSLSCRFQTNLCWISGALLLLLAVIKLF